MSTARFRTDGFAQLGCPILVQGFQLIAQDDAQQAAVDYECAVVVDEA
jgi:hypothetical protein